VQTVPQSVCARVSIGDDGSRLHGEVVGVGKRPSLLVLRGPPKKECSSSLSDLADYTRRGVFWRN
jgi:hypothetical protein